METKYGELPDEQLIRYKQVLHNAIHKLLRFKEENYSNLNRYFVALQWQLSGLNEVLGRPTEIITIISLLESARLEALKEECDFALYRKAVLDSHALVDKIKLGGDCIG